MSDDALIEAMAQAIEVAACEYSDDVFDWTNEAQAALDVARPIIEAPLRAENEKLRERLEKAHSFISRADWMQFFEEEHDAAAALKETGDE